MNSLDRIKGAIAGSCQNPPVVLPYLEYYFPEIVDQVTPFTRNDLLQDDITVRANALSALHEYLDCDWVRVPSYPQSKREPSNRPVPEEQLVETDPYDIASEMARRFDHKFVYAEVSVAYTALFDEIPDIATAMVALKRQPARCLEIMERAIPRRLEEINTWAQVGVHGLWLGQLLCSADIISEADYLKFIFPFDKILIDAAHAAGMTTIHYFCGDVIPRLEHIGKLNPVIVGVEESKKGFLVDIERVRAEIGPKTCILGNIDAYDVLELGSPATWEAEIERQIRAAGPERFIISVGSPVTHDTPPKRLREFIKTAKRVRETQF